ncbi:cysteine--tRNA ligase [Pelagibius litoralis]|uniref:Cysteine--tRNA ligase n=1 Tax=Pelagibius litoralis TaxID=374515 RepID=A0A967K757_9PROT|nr:cysteine--tRNA ligase [Pelagibius litoralis]NIA69643.1 cysteine--tRNA ligase [Pelagibius litoralis]
MNLQLHNTLTRRKERFEPLDPANVRMYVCGPTVYDYAHIGNARPVVVFDVLFRLLRHLYSPGHVTYARNITDVEDKIISAARKSGEPIEAVTKRTAQAYHDDMGALGALPPTVEPRATEHIGQMIAMTETLIGKGHAYAADGHVLFSVASMADYGKLSRHNRDEIIAGARVEVAPYKKDAADFVLWKPSTREQPGWDSPWGRGRPGWHIECSAMAEEHLGQTFDIHGGGLDLVFPHHENEIAQSRCAHGSDLMARVWMHNGYVVVNGEKMSKSLGNYFTVRQLLEEGLRGEAIRLALLSGHYRAPLDITREKVAECKGQLDRLYGALRGVDAEEAAEPPAALLAALGDDLNTPLAVAELHELATAINKSQDEGKREALAGALLAGGALLGLLQDDPDAWFKGEAAEGALSAAEIETMIAARIEARKAKNFAEADRLRDDLLAQGITLEDGPGGTTWKRAD